jgi:hypothetical protein
MSLEKMGHFFSSVKFQIFKINKLNLIYIDSPMWELLDRAFQEETYYFLNDDFFNKKYLTPFEYMMRNRHHAYYFSKKNYLHYDQFEIFKGMERYIGSCAYPLHFEGVSLERKAFFQSLPFQQRIQDRRGLKGDFLSSSKELETTIKRCEEDVFGGHGPC